MMKRLTLITSIFMICTIVLAETSVVFAALNLEGVTTWYWTDRTYVWSVASGDVDGDDKIEIVSGGQYDNGPSLVAQLCVWDGSTLTFENVRTWSWGAETRITTIGIDDVDGDDEIEIITGGWYWDGSRDVAQLCVWNGKTLTLENVATWYWTGNTMIESLAIKDVDNDDELEIVTGGHHNDGLRYRAQLCVWNGKTLTVENFKTWHWTSNTFINSVTIGDVDNDNKLDIVTGGNYHDNTRYNAQLCVWDGATLNLKDVTTWYWTSDTEINSVAIGDVDGDKEIEIITGGNNYDGANRFAQLCVWNGSNLEFEAVTSWYWTSHTYLESVVVGDIDNDDVVEVISGGYYYSGSFYAQLCVWNGKTMAIKDVRTWRWTSNTRIESLVAINLDSDKNLEIITGGYYNSPEIAQLTVWE